MTAFERLRIKASWRELALALKPIWLDAATRDTLTRGT
jgi:hypothetical protein